MACRSWHRGSHSLIARILRVSALTPKHSSEVLQPCAKSTKARTPRRCASTMAAVDCTLRKSGDFAAPHSLGHEQKHYCTCRARAYCFGPMQVFELTREQERTKQAESAEKKAQFTAYAEQERKVSADCTRLCKSANEALKPSRVEPLLLPRSA